MNRKFLQTCAALAALPLISGCVAFAAMPVLAGSAMFAGGNVKIRSATQRPKQASALAPAAPARLAVERTAGVPVAAGSGAVLTTLTALPPPDTVRDAADPWQRFAAYAADRAIRFADDPAGQSVLLRQGTQLALPRMQECAAKVPAVVIDLDSGADLFAPRQGLSARPGLAEGLAKIRETGAVVLWVTGLPAARVGEVAEALRESGLDPAGSDPLLLVRSPGDRKQVLREQANKDVCVIAIAGDRKSDFDELFDYLRDPRSGDSLDYLLGAGWFITPPPLG